MCLLPIFWYRLNQIVLDKAGCRHGFRPAWANILEKIRHKVLKIFLVAHPGFQFAHPGFDNVGGQITFKAVDYGTIGSHYITT